MPQPSKERRPRGRLAMLPRLVAFYRDEVDDPRAISYRAWGLVGDGWTIAVVPGSAGQLVVSVFRDLEEAEDELALWADPEPARHMTVGDIRALPCVPAAVAADMPSVIADEGDTDG